MLSVQVFGPGGKRSEYRSRIFWIDGRRTRAAAKALQRKRPCRTRATARRSLAPFSLRSARSKTVVAGARLVHSRHRAITGDQPLTFLIVLQRRDIHAMAAPRTMG